MKEQKIGFSELSGSLKTLVVFGWIITGIFGLAFLLRVIEGIFGR